jgi:prepilin-type processing-associated H-X9-DG protein
LSFNYMDARRGNPQERAEGLVAAIGNIRENLLRGRIFEEMLNSQGVKPVAGEVRSLVTAALTPQITREEADGSPAYFVSLRLDEQQIHKAMVVAHSVAMRNRDLGRHAAVASHMRALLATIRNSAESNQGMLPESLEAMIAQKQIDKSVIASPDGGRPYVYRRWVPELSKQTPQTPMVWEAEAGSGGGGLMVGFSDGHVEYMQRDAFAKLLKETESWQKQIGGGK